MARVSEIRYVGYAVDDLDAERKFYGDVWGLREVPSDDGLVYFAAEGTSEHHVVRLRQDATKRIDLIAWATSSRDDVDTLFEQVKAAGSKIVAEPHDLTSPGGGYGFRFFDPNGMTIEISSDVATGPSRDLKRGEGIPVKISHVVMHAPDHKATVAFYEKVLGFRVSDWLGDFMCFMRCNEWHHRLAFLPGPPSLNHVAYDVLTVDDMMRGIARLKRNETDIRWGPGRHTAGNNTFSYFTTPAEFAVEYTSELEQVDDDTWEATVHVPGPDTMDQWGTGVGGPHAMPKPSADAGLFQAPAV
ncbi:MAG: oxidoreductase [Lysobacteraceae bacterium]|nr:MAG: oxidoreductase [Xanthomonadaceae bacterium]